MPSVSTLKSTSLLTALTAISGTILILAALAKMFYPPQFQTPTFPVFSVPFVAALVCFAEVLLGLAMVLCRNDCWMQGLALSVCSVFATLNGYLYLNGSLSCDCLGQFSIRTSLMLFIEIGLSLVFALLLYAANQVRRVVILSWIIGGAMIAMIFISVNQRPAMVTRLATVAGQCIASLEWQPGLEIAPVTDFGFSQSGVPSHVDVDVHNPTRKTIQLLGGSAGLGFAFQIETLPLRLQPGETDTFRVHFLARKPGFLARQIVFYTDDQQAGTVRTYLMESIDD